MNLHPDHNKISVTAKLVAYFRQFTDIPFASEVARYTGAREALESIISESDLSQDKLMGLAPMFEARYKSIVSLILKSGFSQVLELASGFSLRGLAMSSRQGLTYIESDLEELTAEKAKLLAELQSHHQVRVPPNYHFASANVLSLDELRHVVRPLDRTQRLVVVNEGLIHYFSVAERDNLLKNVRRLLEDFGGGVWITPDFTLKADELCLSEWRRKIRQTLSGITERSFHAGAFENDQHMRDCLQESGLSAQLHYQIDETPVLTSIAALNLPPQTADKLRPAHKVWVLRLI